MRPLWRYGSRHKRISKTARSNREVTRGSLVRQKRAQCFSVRWVATQNLPGKSSPWTINYDKSITEKKMRNIHFNRERGNEFPLVYFYICINFQVKSSNYQSAIFLNMLLYVLHFDCRNNRLFKTQQ